MRERPIRFRRLRALLSIGCDPISAAFIASLNYVFFGPANGPTCLVGFMHMILDIDDRIHP